MPKLKRFYKKKKIDTKNILISFAVIIGILMVVVISKSYAIYKLQQNYDVIKNEIGKFSTGDVKVAVLVDGEETNIFPSYETNYKVESIDCTNGVTASFDVENWQINIADMSATSTKCTVSFNSKETNEITPVNYTKTELLALNEEYQNIAYESVKAQLLNDIYPIGSIYTSTEDDTVQKVHDRFGGTWVRYAADTTLVGYEEGTNEVNSTGGSKTVTLTEANLPAHTHSISHTHTTSTGTVASSGAHTHTTTAASTTSMSLTASGGAHTHSIYMAQRYTIGGTAYAATSKNTSGAAANSNLMDSSGAHTHTVTGTVNIPALSIASSGAHTHTIPELTTNSQSTTTSGSTGSGTAVNVQNPYTVVYMYKRTA